jgi:galactokinase
MSAFQDMFGRLPVVVAQAPGRVNLIGEHTDYNGGFVLPTPIPQLTQVELAQRADQVVRVASTSVGGGPLEYVLGGEQAGRGWLDYVQGVTQALVSAGHPLRGFDALISSDVPVGSGLSSSAALSISLLRALREAFGIPLDDIGLAVCGQQIENKFVGAQVGIMDPMVCSLGEVGSALFIDTRTLAAQRVPLPPGADLVVLNSGVGHDHSAGDYNTRRSECERACALLGVRQLRDIDGAALPRLAALPEPLGRRARHVVTENERVQSAVEAMKAGDLKRLGQLFYASHASQKDDYAVSIPEIDLMVELARGEPDVYGARLTGGGFGGSVVMLARKGRGADVAAKVAREYAERSGRKPAVLVPRKDDKSIE